VSGQPRVEVADEPPLPVRQCRTTYGWWDPALLLREDKRPFPGVKEGFRAIALLPVIDGTELDVVSSRARSTGHSVEHVVSFEVRGGELVEVGQHNVAARNMR